MVKHKAEKPAKTLLARLYLLLTINRFLLQSLVRLLSCSPLKPPAELPGSPLGGDVES